MAEPVTKIVDEALGLDAEVYLDSNGCFYTIEDAKSGKQSYSYETLKDLRESLRSKLLQKKREKSRVSIPVTVVNYSTVTDYILTGLTGEGYRQKALAKKVVRGRAIPERLNDSTTVYSRFTDEDRAEHKRLYTATVEADKALEAFLTERKLGDAEQVVKKAQQAAQDAGTTLSAVESEPEEADAPEAEVEA